MCLRLYVSLPAEAVSWHDGFGLGWGQGTHISPPKRMGQGRAGNMRGALPLCTYKGAGKSGGQPIHPSHNAKRHELEGGKT